MTNNDNQATSTIKAITIRVFKNPLFSGCSNNGISEKFDDLYLVCDDGNIPLHDPENIKNLVKIVTRQIRGREYKHMEPYAPAKGVGWMAGGAIGYSSDSRFMSDYPLQIHDRDESREEYEIYSS